MKEKKEGGRFNETLSLFVSLFLSLIYLSLSLIPQSAAVVPQASEGAITRLNLKLNP